ncbi:PKD domain-containing protein, partial [Spongiivirga sp. MCCC 1A20706]|uniref:beta strand repeat-containing protein n=1 Tax=Spongiivirga sp. MCCC 1A20706 TaxID=3160963 RepID=UPI003977DB4C
SIDPNSFGDPNNPNPGSYTFTYTLTDAETKSRNVTVNQNPTFNITASPNTGNAPLSVQFNISNLNLQNGTAVASYLWDFGFGSNTSNEENPSFTYDTDNPTPYTVSLIITDSNGCESMATTTVTVDPALEPFIGLGSLPAAVTICQGDIFNDTVFAEDGNGNAIPVTTSSDPNPFDTNIPETYILTYSATGASNVTRTVVVNATPVASFTPDQLTITEGETVNFDASASTASSAITYNWDFGDGSPIVQTTNSITSHEYSNNVGSPFTVTLSIQDANGCISNNTVSQEITVNPAGSATATITPALTASYVNQEFDITIDIDEINGGNGPYTAGYRNATGSFNLSNGANINVDTDIAVGNNITNWTFTGTAAFDASFEIYVKNGTGEEIGSSIINVAVQTFTINLIPDTDPIIETVGNSVDFTLFIGEVNGQAGNEYNVTITTDQGTDGTISSGGSSATGTLTVNNQSPGSPISISYSGTTAANHAISVSVVPVAFNGLSRNESRNINYTSTSFPFNFSANSADDFLFFNNETDINLDITHAGPVGGGLHEVRFTGDLAGGQILDQSGNPVSANTWTSVNNSNLTVWKFRAGNSTGVANFNLEARNASGGVVTGNPQNIQINIIDFAITVNPTTTITETAGIQVTNLSIRIDPTNTSFTSTYNLIINSDQADGIFNAGDTQINTSVNGGTSFNFNYTGTSVNLHNLSVFATPLGQTEPTRTAAFRIDYIAVNQPPVAVDDSNVIVQQNSGQNLILVVGNDSDPENDDFSINQISSNPNKGNATIQADAIDYIPTIGQFGNDTFSYNLIDINNNVSNNAVVSVFINRPPTANNTTRIVNSRTAGITITISAITSDPDNHTIIATNVGSSSNGTTSIGPAQTSIRFVGNGGSWSSTSFSYTVEDGFGGTDTGTITIQYVAPDPCDGVVCDPGETCLGGICEPDCSFDPVPCKGSPKKKKIDR